jgi:uncharacterized protein YecT (DUF1311 family)
MKIVINLALAFITCGVSWAQSGFSGTVSSNRGFTITFQSKLEPSKPDLVVHGASGVTHLEKAKSGMRRFATNTKTHEYFGYDMEVEPINERAGTYRVIFSALTLTPEDLKLPDPANWRMLPAPIFPPPQILSTADTIALDLFENPATGQKIVDYIRLKRDNCDGESAGPGQIPCLNGLVQDARRSLEEQLTKMENTRDPSTVNSIKASQRDWEGYRNDACAMLANEAKRLQCELKLTRSRTHDLGVIY